MGRTRFLKASVFGWILFVTGLFGSSETVLAFPTTMYVTSEVLNVREAPFPDAPISSKLRRNNEILILDSLNGWGAFEDADKPGETFWVSLDHLSDRPAKTASYSADEKVSSSDNGDTPWLLLVGAVLLFGGKGLTRLIGLGLLFFWWATI